ncbi:MAG: hypothetical protein M0P13_07670 [Fibrobacteraceae bacterium]|nr:hypothetical protein [Fibrobacteraceae bacterium]
MNLKSLAVAAALCISPSFAIIGLGVQYAPNFGTSLDKTNNGVIENLGSDNANAGTIQYRHGSFSGMQGLGLKLWIDIIPIIDVEATYNLQWGSYNSTLSVFDSDGKLTSEQPIELKFDGVPFGKATPKFVAMNGDLSITYPITSLPIIRPYIGGGITYYLSTPVMSSSFVKKYFNTMESSAKEALLSGSMDDAEAEALANKLSTQLQDEGLNTNIGGHIILGARFKLPVIPIAAYVNGKYYFAMDYDDEIDASPFVLEAGIGLAL